MKAARNPAIVWTMQRTGGTNLANFLQSLTEFRMQHEPFNRPRIYGEITKAWEKTADRDALQASVGDVLAKGESIKHCVEMVPWAISASIVEASVNSGHRHIFLVRESSLQRLLSMEFASRTKIWGPERRNQIEIEAAVFATPLDVPRLVRHEAMGISRLNKFWELLKTRGMEPIAASFESLYEADPAEASDRLSAILAALGLETSPEALSAAVAKLRQKGNQVTRERYDEFIGIRELQDALRDLPPYVFLK
jgi:LPS sulfotransferase NodH